MQRQRASLKRNGIACDSNIEFRFKQWSQQHINGGVGKPLNPDVNGRGAAERWRR